MKKIFSVIFSALLLVNMLTLAFNIQTVKTEPATIIVPDDYPTIQEAINNANDGDTVYVKTEIYREHVTISKSISLIGEERNATIVDGNGTGTVILITANNVSIINFTIRNAGKTWYGSGYPPSAVSGNGVNYVNVKCNILTDAAVCAWFSSSSFVNITDNIVFNATTAGIIGYASSNILMHHNLVDNCGWMGLHLDGSSTDCNLTDNTVMNTIEGIEIEKSTGNFVERNQVINNNASIVLNQCSGSNSFRENNMTSDWYNLIVWGSTLEAFIQNIDISNTVNNKTVYYLTNQHDLIINPIYYPNLGYLAVVNCTRTTIRDFNITHNGDGLMLAYSTNCTLTNITLCGNLGPLMYGGLTFYKSNNNTIVNNRISSNSYAICLYQSDNNTFHHNFFSHNTVNVVADFLSPFGGSTRISVNFWDNYFEGNYWSDYKGLDENKDGLGDSFYPVVASPTTPPELKQYDHYPLMGIFYSFHAFSSYYIDVISNSTIEDFEYFNFNSTIRMHISNMTENQTFGFVRICIPHALMNETYQIIIDDEEPYYVNYTLYDNGTHRWVYFTYEHPSAEIIIIPEFPSACILPLFIMLSMLVVFFMKKKQPKET